MFVMAKVVALGKFLVFETVGLIRNRNGSAGRLWRLLRSGNVRRCWRIAAFYFRLDKTLRRGYARWVAAYDTLSEDDRARIRTAIAALARRPVISVVMPVYNPPLDHFRSAIESVRTQLYPDWELCIADDASTDERVRVTLREYEAVDPRIRVVYRDQNGHISAASNSALALATGEFVALLDHDDVLPEHALFMVAEEIGRHPDCDIIYSDEDKLDPRGRRIEPYFKPDWNWGLIRSQNMLSHLGVYRTTLVRAVGGFRAGYEGSQDYDLALRCADATRADRIRHIPHVLYHWRIVPGSTAGAVGAKGYAYEAGVRALREHFARRGLVAEVGVGSWSGGYRTKYALPDSAPLVTLIVIADPGQRFDSFQTRPQVAPDYPAVEWVVCADRDQKDALVGRVPGATWIPGEGLSGTTRLNEAAHRARGEVLCFLAPELLPTSTEWLRTVVGYALQNDIGAVGTKVVAKDGAVLHGGYLVTADVPAGDPNRGLPGEVAGPFGWADTTRDCQAVSGACLVVRKDAFKTVGGFDAETFPGSLRDIDLCLRLADSGLRTVWTADASLVWQGPVKVFAHPPGSIDPALPRFRDRWSGRLQPDRFQSPNLRHPDFGFGLAYPPPRTVHDFGTDASKARPAELE